MPWLTELLVVWNCNYKFYDILRSNVISVPAMPIPSQMPKAFNQCSLRIRGESVPKWASNHFVSFFCICESSTVIFTLFILNSFLFFCMECMSPLFLLRWHDSFAVKAVRIQILAQTTFQATIFCLQFCVRNKFCYHWDSNQGRLLSIRSEV